MEDDSSSAARSTKASSSLAASRYRVSFIAKDALDLPSYLGSTLRGAFGHAFRTIACPAPHGDCPLPSQCPYHLIFETSPPPGSEVLRTHEEIPRPFVIAPALTQADTRRNVAEPRRRSPESAEGTLVERSGTSKGVREVRQPEGVCQTARKGLLDVRTMDTRRSAAEPSKGVSDVRTMESRQPGRQQFNPGDEVSFELILIGRAQEFFPYFVVALREVDRIGRGRRTVELQRIEALRPISGSSVIRPLDRFEPNLVPPPDRVEPDPIPPPDQGEVRRGFSGPGNFASDNGVARVVYSAADNLVRGAADSITLEDCATLPLPQSPLTIEFLTQTRLKHQGRFIRHPVFHVVFRRLLGRLSSLARFHCGAPMELDFRGLIEQAASIRLVQDDTRWTRWQRYSSRQERRMEWEGIIGRAVYEGEFAPFWNFLKFGELVHVGHGATFGLGKYTIQG